MNQHELAETGQLQALLSEIGAGLDTYLKFQHADALQHKADWMACLNKSLPQQGKGISRVVEELLTQVIPNGSAIPRPGFSGYITTGATTASALAMVAASIASPQRYTLNAFNFIEELSLEWLADMLSIGHLKGVYSSGGSVANLVALGAARQAAYEQSGIDPALDGINQPSRVYASQECHHTIQRSCGVLGLGRNAVVAIACDEAGRMRPQALREAVFDDKRAGRLPMAIVANAGSTNTGAIDPLQQIADIAQEAGIWLHVDGAYGLPGILDERIAHLYEGLQQADSVIIDPHKWLGASVGVAATFVRDRDILRRAFTQGEADYLEGTVDALAGEGSTEHSMDGFGIPYFDYGVELSSPSRGIIVWSMISEIGVEGMRQRIRRHNDMARFMADFARQHENLELLLEPTLSVCCFRFTSDLVTDLDQFNQLIFRQLIHENEFLPSTTRVNGKLALRPCWIGARSEMMHAQGLLDAVLRIGKKLLSV